MKKDCLKAIAIDGPAGSGKSTLAQRLAQALQFFYLDTGAMYRALALHAARLGLAEDDGEGIAQQAEQIEISFEMRERAQRTLLNGEDVSEAIRRPEISSLASKISVFSPVRRALVAQQRSFASRVDGIVAEGRDTTTVVFPDACLRLFLTASPETRACRRFQEWQARGIDTPYEQVLAEIKERDLRDSSRADSPLQQAEGVILIENDHLDVDQTVQLALQYWQRAMA